MFVLSDDQKAGGGEMGRREKRRGSGCAGEWKREDNITKRHES